MAISTLKKNELRVLELKGTKGLRNADIAKIIHREEVTVKGYWQSIKTKLGVDSVYQAVYLFAQYNLNHAANDNDYHLEA